MGLDQLETKQYIVELDDEAKKVYAEMAETESTWLDECLDAGATVRRIGSNRYPRFVVCVPPGVILPDQSEMADTKYRWLEMAQELARQQGKKDSIGTRSASMPVWIGPQDHTVYEVRHRSTTAYRGARLTFDDAVEYIQFVRERQLEKIGIAEAHYKHDRVKGYKALIEKIDLGLSLLRKINPRQYSARIFSGHACKITVKSKLPDGTKASISDSVPRIALVSVIDGFFKFTPAPTRDRHGASLPFMRLADLVLFVPPDTEFARWEKDILFVGEKSGVVLIDCGLTLGDMKTPGQ